MWNKCRLVNVRIFFQKYDGPQTLEEERIITLCSLKKVELLACRNVYA